MPRKTDGDSPRLHFQSNRFVCQNGEWFYMTREGEERGPFESKKEAEGDLILYIRECLNKEIFSGN